MCYCCISMKDCKKAAIAWAKADTAIEIKSERKRKNHCGKHPEIALYFRYGRKAQSMEICTFCRNEKRRTLRRRRGIEKTNAGSARAALALHPAGRCPNSSFRLPPLAAVAVVAGRSIARPIAASRQQGPTPADGPQRNARPLRYSKKALPSGRALEHNKAGKPYFLKSLPDRPSRFNMPSSAATSAETSSASD